MPKYVIEREMPGVGKLASGELQGASQVSCGAVTELGRQVQWDQSFVTEDKIYCVYNAPGEETIRQQAQLTCLPANRI